MYSVSHRGDSAHAPENTLSAFKLAKSKGSQCVEFDVMLTQEGEAIVFHDDGLGRTTNGAGWVCESSLTYIKTLDAGSWFDEPYQGEKVPTLTEAIELLTELDIQANIEIKPTGENTAIQTAETVLKIVKAYWPDNKALPLISSFNLDCLRWFFENAPNFPKGLLFKEWREDCCQLAKALGCVMITTDQANLTPDRVQMMKQSGLLVFTYTVNDKKLAKRLESYGVDGVFSNDSNLLEEHALQLEKRITELMQDRASHLNQFSKKIKRLQEKIDCMRDYAHSFSCEKKEVVVELAEALSVNLFNFSSKLQGIGHYNQKDIKGFQEEFRKLLHSQDAAMEQHRAIWKPIVANILLALTVLGVVAIAAKMATEFVASRCEHRSMRQHNCFFFTKTQSARLRDEIAETVQNFSEDVYLGGAIN